VSISSATPETQVGQDQPVTEVGFGASYRDDLAYLKMVGTAHLKAGMNFEASQRTAAGVGVWSGFGLASVQAWLDVHKSMPALSQDVLWLFMFLVFLGVPGHLFVVGRGAKPFRRDFLSNPEERARQAEVIKRLFVWLVSAGLVGTLWSLALMAVVD